jgi:hypothetical protein
MSVMLAMRRFPDSVFFGPVGPGEVRWSLQFMTFSYRCQRTLMRGI